jgi:hypothetical protein
LIGREHKKISARTAGKPRLPVSNNYRPQERKGRRVRHGTAHTFAIAEVSSAGFSDERSAKTSDVLAPSEIDSLFFRILLRIGLKR